jgi:hypothetical protein
LRWPGRADGLADGQITKRSQWGFGWLGLAWLLDYETKPTGLAWVFRGLGLVV